MLKIRKDIKQINLISYYCCSVLHYYSFYRFNLDHVIDNVIKIENIGFCLLINTNI